MTAKEYLSEYQWASKEARSLLDSIETIQTRLESTAAKQLEAEGAQHSGSGRDIQSELIIRKVELEEMLLRKYKEILRKREQIEGVIEQVESGRERTLLRMRYIQCMKWEEICVAIGYEWTQTHSIHGKALKEVEQILNAKAKSE